MERDCRKSRSGLSRWLSPRRGRRGDGQNGPSWSSWRVGAPSVLACSRSTTATKRHSSSLGGIGESLCDHPAVGFLGQRELLGRTGVGVSADAVVLGPIGGHRRRPVAPRSNRCARPGRERACGQQLDPAERGGAHGGAPGAGRPRAVPRRAPRAPGDHGVGAPARRAHSSSRVASVARISSPSHSTTSSSAGE